MGVEYYLVNESKKKVLYLGKGMWEDVFPYKQEYTIKDNLKNKLENLYGYGYSDSSSLTRWSNKIKRFAGEDKIFLIADSDDNFSKLSEKLIYKISSYNSDNFKKHFKTRNKEVLVKFGTEAYKEVK